MTECKTITFRPTPEFERQVEALMARWECKRTQAILRAVELAARGPDIKADNDRPAVKAKPASRGYISTSGIDHAKLAAFQEKTGMTHFGKKR